MSGPTGMAGTPADPEAGTPAIPPLWGTADSRPLGALTDFESWSPVLHILFADQTTATLTADIGNVLAIGFNGTIPMPTGPDGEYVDEDIIINLYGFEWDLSEFEKDIESFVATWDVAEHTQFYAVQLDQMGAAIPEPSTYALILGGALGGLVVMRRRKRNA